jgi:hypothetical protein
MKTNGLRPKNYASRKIEDRGPRKHNIELEGLNLPNMSSFCVIFCKIGKPPN